LVNEFPRQVNGGGATVGGAQHPEFGAVGSVVHGEQLRVCKQRGLVFRVGFGGNRGLFVSTIPDAFARNKNWIPSSFPATQRKLSAAILVSDSQFRGGPWKPLAAPSHSGYRTPAAWRRQYLCRLGCNTKYQTIPHSYEIRNTRRR